MDLKGKTAFIAGIGDDKGFGWAIAKALYEAGATVLVGTWTPIYKIFTKSLVSNKFDDSRKCKNGKFLEFAKIYPFDAGFDEMENVPKEILENKRYKDYKTFAIKETAMEVEKDFGKIDILVHSLANAPEVTKPLLETSRNGYLQALSSSAYSLVSMVKYFGPIMNAGGSVISLTYIASERAIPKYGGGMSSAKAALESDTRTLAYEAGREWKIRVNTISAGPLKSRAAKAIGMIDDMINYSKANAPIEKDLYPEEIANTALFLSSDLASAITGSTIYVDNGLHAMGMAVDSKSIIG